jgi:hypothetical protein
MEAQNPNANLRADNASAQGSDVVNLARFEVIAMTPREMKAHRARKPVMAILLCLVALFGTTLLLNISFLGIHGAAVEMLGNANDTYLSLQSQTVKEELVRQKLNKLVDSKLSSRLFENHSECLARGINHADVQFLGRDYTDLPDIRNATIDWVKDNCDRLMFIPQVVAPNQQLGKAKGWAFINEQAKKLVDLIFRWDWSAFTKDDNTTQEKPKTVLSSSGSKHLYLPRHFRLVDCEEPPCKLVYLPPPNTPLKTVSTVPPEAVEIAGRRVVGLQTAVAGARVASEVTHMVWLHLLLLQALFLTALLVIEQILPGDPRTDLKLFRPWLWPNWFYQLDLLEERLFKHMVSALLCRALATVLARSGHYPPLDVSLAIVMFCAVMYGNFLSPRYELAPSLYLLVGSVKDLKHALFDRPTTAPIAVQVAPKTQGQLARPSLTIGQVPTAEALLTKGHDPVTVRNKNATDGTAEDSLFVDAQLDPEHPEDVELNSDPDTGSAGSEWSVVEKTVVPN